MNVWNMFHYKSYEISQKYVGSSIRNIMKTYRNKMGSGIRYIYYIGHNNKPKGRKVYFLLAGCPLKSSKLYKGFMQMFSKRYTYIFFNNLVNYSLNLLVELKTELNSRERKKNLYLYMFYTIASSFISRIWMSEICSTINMAKSIYI